MTNIEQLMQDSEVMRMLKLGNPERSKNFNAPELAVGLFDIERQLKDPLETAIYNSPDPNGTIASFDTALMLNNLGIDMPSAHKMAKMGFSSSITGIDTRDKNYWEALKTTAQHSHWQDMKGITTSLYRITGNRDFLELANGYDGKIRTNPVSNTYGEMGDLVLDSVQPAMSSMKFMATTALLSWIPGGVANKVWGPAVAKTIAQGGGLAANAVNWFSTGYSQAGDVLYNVMQMEDAEGNKLPWDSPIGGILFHSLAGLMGLVELGSMEMFPWYKQLKTRFTDRELVKHIERGLLAATRSFLWKGGAGTISEGGEEGLQTGLGIGFENALKAMANKDGSDFELTSFGDTIDEAAKATLEAGKSMFLTSFLTAGLGQGVYSMRLRASAKKNFLSSKDSIPIDSMFVGVPKHTNEQTEVGVSTGPLEPIRVVNVGTHLAPVDDVELKKAARAKANGAEAMEVVVQDMLPVESEDQLSILHRAAIATEAKIIGDSILGFTSEEDLDRATYLLAPNTEAVEKSENGMKVTVRGEDGRLSRLSLELVGEGQEATDPDISYIDDPKAPYSLSAMTTERALEWQERQLIKESLGDIVSHTGGRISTTDFEANVDAVKLVAETLEIPTDQMLRENLVFKLEKASPKGERGYIENVSIEGKKRYTIHVSEKADATTILHEVGHFMRGTASKEQLAGFTSYYGKGHDAVWLEDIDKVGDQYVVNGKHFETFDEAKRLVEANEEAFADDFVAYLRTGEAPTEGLRNIFRRMKAVLQRFVREFGYQLDPAVKQAFDRLLGGGPHDIKGSFGTIPSDAEGNTLFQGVEGGQRLKELREAEPIELLGTEIFSEEDIQRAHADIEKHDTPLWKELKKKALEYGKHLRGSYPSHDGDVIVNRDSIKELLIHDFKNIEHLQSIAAIPSLISNSIHIATRPNHNSHSPIKEFDYHVAGLRIGGTDYTVKSVISKTVTGKRYYDHKLTVIEKGELMDLVSALSSTALQDTNSPISTMNDKRLVSVLQDANSKKLFQLAPPAGSPEYGKLAENAHSALRNPDGTLKVFYHGSDVRLEDYDPNKLGFMTGSPTAEGGFFFTEDEEVAQEYAELAVEARPLREDQYRLEAEMEVLRERESELWKRHRNDEITEDDYWQLEEELDEEIEVVRLAIDKIMVALATGDLYDWDPYTEPVVNKVIVSVPRVLEVEGDVSIRDTIEQARKDGYDAVYFKDIEDSPYGTVANNLAVFNPEHIHSLPYSQDVSSDPNGSEQSLQDALYQLDEAQLAETSPWRNRSEIIVRDPGQIKSVTNIGIRDSANPNILFQPAPPIGSDDFIKWFGDSKIVDELGNPQKVYHGSATKILEFSHRYGSLNTHAEDGLEGFFFTPAFDTAEMYAEAAMPPRILLLREERKGILSEFKSQGISPYTRFLDPNFEHPLLDRLEEVENSIVEAEDAQQRGTQSWEPTIIGAYLRIENPKIITVGRETSFIEDIRNAKDKGHDGIIFKDPAENDPDYIVAFEDVQIGVVEHYMSSNGYSTPEKTFKGGDVVSYDGIDYIRHDPGFEYSKEALDGIAAGVQRDIDRISEQSKYQYTFDFLEEQPKAPENRSGKDDLYYGDRGRDYRGYSNIRGWDGSEESPTIDGDWKRFRKIDFTGLSIRSSEDVAKLFSIYRNPQVEFFHLILTKKDLEGSTIVRHHALTSGLPGFAIAVTPQFPVDIQAIMKDSGADGYYMVHNHPSGRIDPSPDDMNVTKRYEQSIAGLNGHIILDHNAYTVIDPDMFVHTKNTSGFHEILGRKPIAEVSFSSDGIAEYALKMMTERKSLLIYLNNQGKVLSAEPADAIDVEDTYKKALEDSYTFTIYVTRDKKEYKRVLDEQLRISFENGRLFTDVIHLDGDKITSAALKNENGMQAAPWTEYYLKNNIDSMKQFVFEGTRLYQLSDDSKQLLLESRKRDVMEAVRNFYWIPEQVVHEYAGEEWADNEIRFRKHLKDYPWILEEARKFSDTDEFLEHLQTSTDMGEYRWVLEDELWFKRVHAYSRIMSPKDKDSQFIRFHTGTDKALIELGRRLRGYEDVQLKRNSNRRNYRGDHVVFRWGAFKGVSPVGETSRC